MQLDIPEVYSPKMLKDDMLAYLNTNADYFTVTALNFRFSLLCLLQ